MGNATFAPITDEHALWLAHVKQTSLNVTNNEPCFRCSFLIEVRHITKSIFKKKLMNILEINDYQRNVGSVMFVQLKLK